MLRFACRASLVIALICLALAAWTLRNVLLALFGAFILANGISLAANILVHKWGLRYTRGGDCHNGLHGNSGRGVLVLWRDADRAGR